MSYYDVDFTALIKMLLPVRLRKTITINWLKSLVVPVKELYDKFYQNRSNNIYTLTHNSQVVRLQAVLNDVFDPTARGIYIIDGTFADPLYVYRPLESHPLYLGRIGEAPTTFYDNPCWLYTWAEVAYTGYSFVVKVPVAVVWDTQRMNALIDKYRLPSRNAYQIVTY